MASCAQLDQDPSRPWRSLRPCDATFATPGTVQLMMMNKAKLFYSILFKWPLLSSCEELETITG